MKIRTLFGESGQDSFPYASWLIQSAAAPAVSASITLFALTLLPNSYEEAMTVPVGYLFAVLFGAVFAAALSWLRPSLVRPGMYVWIIPSGLLALVSYNETRAFGARGVVGVFWPTLVPGADDLPALIGLMWPACSCFAYSGAMLWASKHQAS